MTHFHVTFTSVLNGYKRFATTEAEIEEKRLKLSAERTKKQNKAAENGKNIAYNYTVTCIMCAV
jgi:hypothetical protein